MNPFIWTLAIFFCGCAASSPWVLDTLGAPASDSKRLIYRTSSSIATLEFYCKDNRILSYFSTTGRRFGGNSTASARLLIGAESLEEAIPLHEGKMRARLPDEWTVKAIEALKEGREIAILVGSVEETIQPERFAGFYQQLLSKDFFR